MHGYSFKILTALSLQVGGVTLTVKIDDDAGTARIVQKGEPLNGEAGVMPAALDALAKRLKRARPDLRLEEPT